MNVRRWLRVRRPRTLVLMDVAFYGIVLVVAFVLLPLWAFVFIAVGVIGYALACVRHYRRVLGMHRHPSWMP